MAIALACDFAFSKLDQIRVEAGVFEHNLGSMKVLAKNGFQLKGVAKKRGVKNDKVIDVYQYAKINPMYL